MKIRGTRLELVASAVPNVACAWTRCAGVECVHAIGGDLAAVALVAGRVGRTGCHLFILIIGLPQDYPN